ncbi:MAG: tetratricopeptide repeat protein [Sorangiineae bacterium]|nr:tetratricopeptide repeat protein [Sorangiineae bacterium]
MTRVARLGAAVLGLAAALASSAARAEPSLWDVARDPAEARASVVLRAAERKLIESSEASFDPGAPARFTRAAIAMLELARGRELPDPRLRYLLGSLLADSSVRRYAEARVELERALREAPDSPLAGDAWFTLGVTFASLDDPRKEIDAYGHALGLLWRRDQRATLYMNRGEAWMRLYELRPALADFRAAVASAESPVTVALAAYDLGVGLERSGDLPSALDAVARGAAVRIPSAFGPRSVLDVSSVFFVPDYEDNYYRALEAMALARQASPAEAAPLYESASRFWERYAARAAKDRPPWLAHAALLASSCRDKARALERASPKPHRR